MLKESDALVKEEQCVHSYPYDWRTKQPVIIRPSKQWFVNTASLKDKAKVKLEDILVPLGVINAVAIWPCEPGVQIVLWDFFIFFMCDVNCF